MNAFGRELIGIIVLGAALPVPVAQAERPDDRAGARGPGAFAAQAPTVTHPDNRGGIHGPGAFEGQPVIRPDGSCRSPWTGAAGSPEPTVATHPDNRADPRGPGSVTAVLVERARAGSTGATGSSEHSAAREWPFFWPGPPSCS